jgi:hypothetical protein
MPQQNGMPIYNKEEADRAWGKLLALSIKLPWPERHSVNVGAVTRPHRVLAVRGKDGVN